MPRCLPARAGSASGSSSGADRVWKNKYFRIGTEPPRDGLDPYQAGDPCSNWLNGRWNPGSRTAAAGNERGCLEQAGAAAGSAAREAAPGNRDRSRSPDFWPGDQLLSYRELVFDSFRHSNDAQGDGIVLARPQERGADPGQAQSYRHEEAAEPVPRLHAAPYQRPACGHE